MPPRPEDLAAQQVQGEVIVRLPDLEPVAGLVAACARLSAALTADAVMALPDSAVDAITTIQAILWRLEHAPVESQPSLEPAE